MHDSQVSGTRQLLRTDLRQRRRAISPADRIRAANEIAARLLTLPFAPQRGYAAGYWATDGEIALHAWFLALPADVIPCLPVLRTDRLLGFAPWRVNDPIHHNRYGIPEPVVEPSSLLSAAEMSLIVMPMVGFDRDGTRLGMGGGWYDRSLSARSEHPAPPWLVAVGYDEQEIPPGSLEPQPWDVGPDAICTPSRTLFTSRS